MMIFKKTIFISLLLVPFLVFAQNGASLPNPGLTPESNFYFLDKFGEALREFFTFNPEGKARLQITFAAERIAEIKVILETKGADAKGLEIAQSRLQAHLANAATIVTDQRADGKEVSVLARELDDELEGPKTALEQTFKEQKRALEIQEKDLKQKILAARRGDDTVQVESLVQQLGQVKAQKELLELKEEESEEALEQEEERLEEEMEAKAEAEKKIRKAEKEKQELLDEAAEESLTIPTEAFAAFEEHLKEAKEALAAGNFKEAKHHAEEAKESLEAVEDAIDDLEDAKEEEEELKEEDEEEKNGEDAEQLEGEQNKAEEKIRKAEERLREAGKIDEEDEEDEHQSGDKQGAVESPTPQTITVVVRSGRFDDSEVDIKRGDTVRWANQDSQPHWPASNPHPVHTSLPGFDALRSLAPGESYEFTFTQSGTFGYHDHLNPSITGRVIVK